MVIFSLTALFIVAIAILEKKIKTVEDHIDFMNNNFYNAYEEIKNKLPNSEKKLFYYSEGGELTRAHSTDAGMDICSNEEYVLKAGERHLFKTGIYGILPKGTDAKVTPRSGLALKQGIDVLAGEIDENYTGEIGVVLINHGQEDFSVKVGDRIAQLVLRDVYQTQPEKISLNLFNVCKENKDRGSNGYGSSGVNGDKN